MNCWCYSTSCALRTAGTWGLAGALDDVLGVLPAHWSEMCNLCAQRCAKPPPMVSPPSPLPAALEQYGSDASILPFLFILHTCTRASPVVATLADWTPPGSWSESLTSLQWPRPGDGTWPPWACDPSCTTRVPQGSQACGWEGATSLSHPAWMKNASQGRKRCVKFLSLSSK